jgi:hypothetical protein
MPDSASRKWRCRVSRRGRAAEDRTDPSAPLCGNAFEDGSGAQSGRGIELVDFIALVNSNKSGGAIAIVRCRLARTVCNEGRCDSEYAFEGSCESANGAVYADHLRNRACFVPGLATDAKAGKVKTPIRLQWISES